MPEKFDPYHHWLGIPASEQPPHYYRLLGIPAFEEDTTVIESASDLRMGHLRTFQTGKHVAESQRLLNEVAAARVCLLNREKKSNYDESLRQRLQPRSEIADPPRAEPLHPGFESILETMSAETSTIASRSRRKKSQPKSTAPKPAALITVAAVIVATIGVAVVWWAAGHGSEPGDGAISKAEKPANSTTPRTTSAPKSSQPLKKEIPAPATTGAKADSEADVPSTSDPKTSDPKTSDPKTSDPKTSDPKANVPIADAAKPPPDAPSPWPPPIADAKPQPQEGDATSVKHAANPAAADKTAPSREQTPMKEVASAPADLQHPMVKSDFPRPAEAKDRGHEKPPAEPKGEAPPVASAPAARPHPPLAIAPFNEKAAKQHQARWAKYLNALVVQSNSIGMKLVLIPPGEFMMGSPKELFEEESRLHAGEHWFRDQPRDVPQHRVRISKPFWLGTTVVTQAQYLRVMRTNPSHFQGDPKSPAEQVSWHEAVEFCRRLSEMPLERSARRRYQLPTEAQWEYACRAGNLGPRYYSTQPSPFPLAMEERLLAEYAFFGDAGQTQSVGRKKANAWLLSDMYGNVWEWCQDWYDKDYYAKSPVDDPEGPASGSVRVRRGGSWNAPAAFCRSAYRDGIAPGDRFSGLGFRVSMVMVEK